MLKATLKVTESDFNTLQWGGQTQMRRNHFPNIHISKAEIKRQMAKHPVLLFSHKPENALKALFHSINTIREVFYQYEPGVQPPVNFE